MLPAEKQTKKIIKATKKNMESIGIYRHEFDPTIRTYAEMRQQYDALMIKFYDSGCEVTEEYTNKSGYTNIRKTALYLALETLRKDIVNYENILGLTPIGIKKINNSSKPGRVSKLGKALSEIARE